MNLETAKKKREWRDRSIAERKAKRASCQCGKCLTHPHHLYPGALQSLLHRAG